MNVVSASAEMNGVNDMKISTGEVAYHSRQGGEGRTGGEGSKGTRGKGRMGDEECWEKALFTTGNR